MSTLGDRIKASRQAFIGLTDQAREDAIEWACQYADDIRDAIRDYIDNQVVVQLRSYVDAARDQVKTYVDNQILTTQAQSKAYVDSKDAALGARIDSLIAHNGLTP